MSDLNPAFQAAPETPATAPAPAAPRPPAQAPAPQEPAAASPEAATKPPWGSDEDFDPQKAWDLIQNLRTDKDRLTRRELTADQQQKLAEYDRLVEASKTDLQRAQEAAQTNEKRAQALLDRAVKAEVRALAAEGFADPADASAFLDLSKYANGDGDVDSDAIKADLTDLLARKPHLGKSPASRVPAPNPAQGSSGSGAPGAASQLSKADVEAMYARKDYDGIAKAQAEGRLNDYLASK